MNTTPVKNLWQSYPDELSCAAVLVDDEEELTEEVLLLLELTLDVLLLELFTLDWLLDSDVLLLLAELD